MLRTRYVYLAWVVLHFLFIITVSCRETLWLIAHGLTIIPHGFSGHSQKAGRVAAAPLDSHLNESHPLRQILGTYLGLAGIEAGYGYFAPNVPNSYKLVFELHYTDGHTEYRLPRVNSAAAAVRLASLLEQVGRTPSDALREYMVKRLATVIWREHSEVKTMRAALTQMVQPTIADYELGKKETYELLYAYDFSLASESTKRPGQ